MLEKIEVTCKKLSEFKSKKLFDIDKRYYQETGYKSSNEYPKDGWIEFSNETKIIGENKHFWIKLIFTTPSIAANKYVVLNLFTGLEGLDNTLNPQGMVFIDGNIVQAVDTNHSQVKLEQRKKYEVYVYLYNGSAFEYNYRTFLSEIDEPTEQLYYDIFVPMTACKDVYYTNSSEYAYTIKVLTSACNMLQLNYPYSNEYYEGINKATEYLRKEFYGQLCGNSRATVNCIGHTHIDVAWLWTLAQTREKIQRSCATALKLMEQYPEYKFMMSQPQLFKFLSENDPNLYNRIKELVKEGRWEMEGAMWLEADCNLTSGESLVRQIIHGKRFLKREFNIESKVLWLPDVFGYSASIPQILKKSGIEYFVTSKISWNDTNVMPYDTFMWQGIDGSEIFTNFITVQDFKRGGKFDNETIYNGPLNTSRVAGTWNRYQQKEYNEEVLLVYGHGDGGGGPTSDMLEQQRRLSFGLPGMPKTRITSLKEHLENVKNNFKSSCVEIGKIPKWIGELYLEFHRGTYTSMAKNKLYNRLCEMLMQRTESLAAIYSSKSGNMFDKQKLYDLWEIILLNQFHDIIPGSSIKEVYDESHNQYESVILEGKSIIWEILNSIASNTTCNNGIFVYNSLGFDRKDIIIVDGVSYETPLIPSYGWSVISPVQSKSKVHISGNMMENDYFVIEIDYAGRISNLFDKRYGRSVFKKGSLGNEFQVFEDFPLRFDNWEIAPYYSDKCSILCDNVEIETVDDGCRKGLKISREYHNSKLIQYIYLYNTIERIDVKNVIDWHEHNQLVKIAFPFNIHSDYTTFDIQFGNVNRKNNSNTSWDTAKFEVCGHKWVDFSEYDYGVSLLNDCKYGFSMQENTLKLTAIKCGTDPNKEADQGLHEFTYSIYPHYGDFRIGNTIREAYSLNQPFEYVSVTNNENGAYPDKFSFVKCDCKNIVIDTIKQSYDDIGIVIRIFDAFNCKSNPRLTFGVPIIKAEICDMLENAISKCDVVDNSLQLEVNNFEIVTIKVHTR